MLYYLNRKAFSYNTSIIMLVGGRGIGKTYSTKKFVLNKFFKSGKKFIWLRSTEKMVEQLKMDGGRAFISDILENKEFNFDFNVKIDGDGTINIHRGDEKETCGYLLALSTFHNLKGNSFADIDYIVFDEFIPEKGEIVRGCRPLQFVNTIQTILRLKTKAKVIMLANALDLADPILCLFFNNIKTGEFGYYLNKEKSCLLHYIENTKEFTERTANSISGKILKGTPYEDVINNNKFISNLTLLQPYSNFNLLKNSGVITLPLGVFDWASLLIILFVLHPL